MIYLISITEINIYSHTALKTPVDSCHLITEGKQCWVTTWESPVYCRPSSPGYTYGLL